MDLHNKHIIIFGGTSGIGLATAHRLHQRGASVVSVSRNPDRARSLLPNDVRLVAADVRDRGALTQLFSELGTIDGMVCTATGGERASGPFLSMDLDSYQRSFDKLWGYTNCVRLGAQHLTEIGAIVLVSGTPARRAKPGQIALASVGSAVEQFCRGLAGELRPRRINVVSPGIIDTPMFGDDAERRGAMLQKATHNHLIPRPGRPDEVAQAIQFVLENDFVTGTTIDVDGGWILS